MTTQTGPLPENWRIKDGFLIDRDNHGGETSRYILDGNKRIDRLKIETILENHGYVDHAKKWHLTSVEVVADELLSALKILHDETADYIIRNNLGDVYHNTSMKLAKIAILKAEVK